MLSLKSLIHSYNNESTINYPDWEVTSGDHAMILGNSGSGKTTLLHLIGGLLRPSSGEITIEETIINKMPQSALDKFRGENIGIVFQKPHLVSSLSIFENLTLAQYLAKKKIDKKRILQIMEQLDIADLKSRRIHEVSQGQAQRVSIARAVVNNPKLLLADEPTASLDDDNCQKVIQLLKQQAKLSSSTLVVATHDQRVKVEIEKVLEL